MLRKQVTPVQVFFCVPEGSGTVERRSGKQTVEKEMPVENPERICHTSSNESPSVFRVIRVKVPGSMEETILL